MAAKRLISVDVDVTDSDGALLLETNGRRQHGLWLAGFERPPSVAPVVRWRRTPACGNPRKGGCEQIRYRLEPEVERDSTVQALFSREREGGDR